MLSASMALVTSDTKTSSLDLHDLFTQTAVPQECAGLPTYFTVQPHMTWNEFLDRLPADTPGLSGWKACRQCRNSWCELSTLSTPEGEPVFFGGDPDNYPEPARGAVRGYQHSFRKSQVTDRPLRYVPMTERHEAPNLGRQVAGADEEGHPYHHAFLETGLPVLTSDQQRLQDKVNSLVHQEVPDLERYLVEWAPHVVQCILDWYTAKGESAAGYRVNIGGLRFLNALHAELTGVHDSRKRRCIVLRHLLQLFKGDHPADACGGIHVFANGSNMAVCRYADSPTAFWRMMDRRYNPVTYRQPTSTPSEGQVKAALALVDNDLSCFERELLTEDDPQVVKRAYWRYNAASNQSQTTMTADQLLTQVRSKAAASARSAKSTCFDRYISAPVLTPDEFEQWLAALPPGSRLEYSVPTTVFPLEMGQPVTNKGREMVKVPVGWVLPASGIYNHDLGIGWQEVRQVLPHPGRWRAGTESDPYPVVSRDDALVSDGYVVQLAQPHTWRPDCSCLFAQFFRGEYHALDKTRQELHKSLRMSVPHGDSEPLRGVMLECKLRGSTYRLRTAAMFRATTPDARVLTVCVE